MAKSYHSTKFPTQPAERALSASPVLRSGGSPRPSETAAKIPSSLSGDRLPRAQARFTGTPPLLPPIADSRAHSILIPSGVRGTSGCFDDRYRGVAMVVLAWINRSGVRAIWGVTG